MQVTHNDDHITHAVIGGGKTIDFGISNNAEFFHILSSTLYTNQELAVVREVLCNAWDAHIEAGCTDKAVIISTKDGKFSVQDFGHGIHKDKIGPIYGTYGASTKKNDGGQTGGFGLGCKAPFAYTDHFEVISCHDGIKTIYSMSKSSAEVGGKPGIIPIASFPTAESGITVSLAFKQASGRYTFENYIKHITRNGEMKVELNGQLLEVHSFSSMTEDFLVTKQLNQDHQSNERIYVRYGNVVYPVPENGAYTGNYRYIEHYLEQLQQSYSSRYSIVFQAPAHSIGVTPSRESLSMQEHTIKTLTQLLDNFVDRLKRTKEKKALSLAKQYVERAIADGKTGLVLRSSHSIPGLVLSTPNGDDYITNTDSLVTAHAIKHYPNFAGFRHADLMYRVDGLLAAKTGNRGLLQTYKAALVQSQYAKSQGQQSWFHKRIAGPLLTDIAKEPELSANRLLTYGHMYAHSSSYFDDGTNRFRDSVVPLANATSLPLSDCLPYLRNIIVIAHSRNGLQPLVKALPEIKDTGGLPYTFLLYTAPRSKAKVEAAVKFFQERGMVVLDVTDSQKPEVKPVAVTKRPKGVVSWGEAWDGEHVCFSRARAPSAARIEKPEWFARMPSENSHEGRYCCLGKFDSEITKAILSLFGSKGGITSNTKQEDGYKTKGSMELETYVIQNVSAEIVSNPRIAEYFSNCPTTANKTYKAIYASKVLCGEFQLVNNLTDEDKLYLQLFTYLTALNYTNQRRCSSHKELQAAREFAVHMAPSAAATTLLDLSAGSKMMKFIDIDNMISVLESKPAPTQAQTADILAILHLALKP